MRAGKYQWIEKSYGDDEDEEEDGANVAGSSKKQEEEEKIPDSTLGPELQQLVKLIFNQSYVLSVALRCQNVRLT